MTDPLDRRRVIAIMGAAAGLGLIPFGRESMAEARRRSPCITMTGPGPSD